MEQGSSLNEDADISDFPEVNLSVPSEALFLTVSAGLMRLIKDISLSSPTAAATAEGLKFQMDHYKSHLDSIYSLNR